MEINVSIKVRRPTWLHRPRSRRGLTCLLAALLTLGVPAGAFASDRFTDVPTDSIFHSAINAIAGAGITLGCGGTNYCPSANVTREQMAAFMHRGFSRAAAGGFGSGTVSAMPIDLSVLTIKAGEATGGTVFIKLDGYVTSYKSDAMGCPCETFYWIERDGGAPSREYYNQLMTVGFAGYALDSGAVGDVVAVPTGATYTFRLKAQLLAGAEHSAEGQLFAIMAPFGSQGTSAP